MILGKISNFVTDEILENNDIISVVDYHNVLDFKSKNLIFKFLFWILKIK